MAAMSYPLQIELLPASHIETVLSRTTFHLVNSGSLQNEPENPEPTRELLRFQQDKLLDSPRKLTGCFDRSTSYADHALYPDNTLRLG